MNLLAKKNVEYFNDTYHALLAYDSGDDFTLSDADKIKPLTYTKKQLADSIGVTTDRIQTVIEKFEAEGEYFAKDGRNWHMMTRDQALHILQEFGVKSIQDKRAEDPDNYETPVIVVNKGKGGVGKTTSSVHIAVEAANDVKKNRRVLLCDGDIQGSLRHYMAKASINEQDFESVSELIKNNAGLSREERLSPVKQQEFRDCLLTPGPNGEPPIVLESMIDNLWFIPSVLTDIELGITIASELGHSGSSEHAITLYNDIIIEPLRSEFELIVIDSGPSPDAIAFNLMYAANHLIIPTTGRTQDYRAFLQYLMLVGILIEQLMPSGFAGFHSTKALICKHQKNDTLETTVNRIAAVGQCFATRIYENKKYEEAAKEKLPLQILKTANTAALTDALKSLKSLYSEIDALISVHEFKR